jgi:hypothetical protein
MCLQLTGMLYRENHQQWGQNSTRNCQEATISLQRAALKEVERIAQAYDSWARLAPMIMGADRSVSISNEGQTASNSWLKSWDLVPEFPCR